MRAASGPIRLAWAALFALLLMVRSLAPAGFMPAFDHGSITIIACPDADAAAVSAARHHHHPADHALAHHRCPYAAMSGLGALGFASAAFLAVTFFAATVLLGRSFLLVARHAERERPPAIGPPIFA